MMHKYLPDWYSFVGLIITLEPLFHMVLLSLMNFALGLICMFSIHADDESGSIIGGKSIVSVLFNFT